uniref:Uncharacterized protein n=1 Tax=Ditylenchus dipsaci TaxID=166011 RepID=A0A915DFE2_9BILA
MIFHSLIPFGSSRSDSSSISGVMPFIRGVEVILLVCFPTFKWCWAIQQLLLPTVQPTTSGKWCLIGVRNEDGNGRLDQICGWDDAERPVDCAQSWSKWSEVCACEEDLCNTFAYLRGNMDTRSLGGRSSDAQDEPEDIYREKEEPLSFFDSPYPLDKRRQSNRGWYQGNNLVVLLVIIPLCVGGFVVCLVFLNYHCKMS